MGSEAVICWGAVWNKTDRKSAQCSCTPDSGRSPVCFGGNCCIRGKCRISSLVRLNLRWNKEVVYLRCMCWDLGHWWTWSKAFGSDKGFDLLSVLTSIWLTWISTKQLQGVFQDKVLGWSFSNHYPHLPDHQGLVFQMCVTSTGLSAPQSRGTASTQPLVWNPV